MDRLEEGNKIVWKDIIVLFVCSFNKYLSSHMPSVMLGCCESEDGGGRALQVQNE